MKGTVRVTAGSLKGKAIPFINSRFGDADITPQKVKGALFSILGEELDGMVFLDLYAGSGQAGIEAISRGCRLAVFSESDRRRYSFIKDFLGSCCLKEQYLCLNMKASSVLKLLHEKNITVDIFFLDPPYDRERGGGFMYTTLLETISDSGAAGKDPVVVIQHYAKNILPERAGMFVKRFTRDYGTTALSVYDAADLSSGDSDGKISEC